MFSSVSSPFVTLLVWLACLEATQAQTGPLVTLSHGGQLRGRSFTYNGTDVDLFLGKFVTADISVISEGFTVPYIFLIWKLSANKIVEPGLYLYLCCK